MNRASRKNIGRRTAPRDEQYDHGRSRREKLTGHLQTCKLSRHPTRHCSRSASHRSKSPRRNTPPARLDTRSPTMRRSSEKPSEETTEPNVRSPTGSPARLGSPARSRPLGHSPRPPHFRVTARLAFAYRPARRRAWRATPCPARAIESARRGNRARGAWISLGRLSTYSTTDGGTACGEAAPSTGSNSARHSRHRESRKDYTSNPTR